MKRTHIHFTDRLPKPLPPLDPVYQSKSKAKEEGDKSTSGMRLGATIVVWVDVRKSMQAGVAWWRSQNGVFLTKGLESKEREGEWVLGFEFFEWVERRVVENDGEILYGEKVVGVRNPVEEAGEGMGAKMGALSVNGDRAANGQEILAKKVEVPAVVKDSWDDGDE